MLTGSQLKPDCSYPVVLGKSRPRSATQQAAMDRGTALHMMVQAWLEGQPGRLVEYADPEVPAMFSRLQANWSPPPIGATCEAAWGLTPYGVGVPVKEPEPHVYRALDGSELLTAGRNDVDWMEPKERILTVVDVKSGRYAVPPAAINLQVNGAGLALTQLRGATGYAPAIYYARTGEWDIGDLVERGSDDWDRKFAAVKAAALLPLEPRPGPHCLTCWERKNCPDAERGA